MTSISDGLCGVGRASCWQASSSAYSYAAPPGTCAPPQVLCAAAAAAERRQRSLHTSSVSTSKHAPPRAAPSWLQPPHPSTAIINSIPSAASNYGPSVVDFKTYPQYDHYTKIADNRVRIWPTIERTWTPTMSYPPDCTTMPGAAGAGPKSHAR
jgi:hypothetical protein